MTSSHWREQRSERRAFSLGIAALVASALLVPAPAAGAPSWRDAIASVLDERARAVRAGDRDAFAATMAGAPRAFVDDRLAWLGRVRQLPLTTYELELDDDAPLDLSPALTRRPRGDEVRVVVVIERMALGRYDPEPSAAGLVLTMVRTGDRWRVDADDDLDDLGIFSDRELWDLGDVTIAERSQVLTVHQTGTGDAAAVSRGLERAIEQVEGAWPLRWPGRVVLAIPADAGQLETIFHTTVDLSPFVAFAASTAERDGRDLRVGGARVFIQPNTYFDQPASFRSTILAHEMVHVAAMAQRGAFTTTWLEEGVAQFYAATPVGAPTGGDAVAEGPFAGMLPEDHDFFLGTEDRIGASYDASVSFMGFLARRAGPRAPARFSRAVGAESPVSFGTARYHLDRAARRTFGTGFDALERAWGRSLSRG